MLLTAVVSLKLADVGLGYSRNSFERHLLRLPANVEVRHRSAEFDYMFRTNSLGLRGPEIPLSKPDGVFRIVVLGDSFVAGWGVPDADIFTARLEKKLNDGPKRFERIEVINVGRVGSSTVRQLDLYELVARRFDPDLVVLAYYLGNDLAEATVEQDRSELAAWHPQGMLRRIVYAWCPNLYLELAILRQAAEGRRQFEPRSRDEVLQTVRDEARQQGCDPQSAVDHYAALPSEVQQQVEQGLLSQHRVLPACYDPKRVRRALDPEDSYLDKAWPRTEEHLARLQQAVTADGARLAIVAIPDAAQVESEAWAFDSALGYEVEPAWLHSECRTQRALATWAKEHGVDLLDLTDSLRAAPDPCYCVRDQHFNAAGHALAAERLAEFLRDR